MQLCTFKWSCNSYILLIKHVRHDLYMQKVRVEVKAQYMSTWVKKLHFFPTKSSFFAYKKKLCSFQSICTRWTLKVPKHLQSAPTAKISAVMTWRRPQSSLIKQSSRMVSKAEWRRPNGSQNQRNQAYNSWTRPSTEEIAVINDSKATQDKQTRDCTSFLKCKPSV